MSRNDLWQRLGSIMVLGVDAIADEIGQACEHNHGGVGVDICKWKVNTNEVVL